MTKPSKTKPKAKAAAVQSTPLLPELEHGPRLDLDEAVAGGAGTTSVAGLNHHTLDKEIEYQEKAVAQLRALLEQEEANLGQLIAERDSLERQERRKTENPDGTKKWGAA